jgi:hypothetical protein
MAPGDRFCVGVQSPFATLTKLTKGTNCTQVCKYFFCRTQQLPTALSHTSTLNESSKTLLRWAFSVLEWFH